MAIAEQDFNGSGDLCIRCHSTSGWYGGRSEPTDGSGLAEGDSDGVDCDTCHTMANPDNSEHQGVQVVPYIANDETDTPQGYYGSGMLSLSGDGYKLGPYIDAEAKHKFQQSMFHRSVDFCGSCHDVSNPVTGDLAPNYGSQLSRGPVVASGNIGTSVENKAAFNNFPFMYGVVERTFSEYKTGLLSQTAVSDFGSLPTDLKTKGGAIELSYQAALLAGTYGNYADGSTRYFSCQSCHMRPVSGFGANKSGLPLRQDLPLHDMTGGNSWIGDIIKYQDSRGHLRLGGGLSNLQIEAIEAGQGRALQMLKEAATLIVNENTLKVINLTGHKLISGYPEGRRMWINIKWFDEKYNLLREDGAYGPIGVSVANPAGGPDITVESIIDLEDPNTKIYEAHYGITQEWAAKLISVSQDYGSLIVGYDRRTGNPMYTLADIANQPPGTNQESFHFVLNDTVIKDNRIPPYGMNYEDARRRNTLPVPSNQYGDPGQEGIYDYFDEIELNPPDDAEFATIDLLYQGTSWEYIQFLFKANNGQNAFLGQEGINMLEAWLNTGMVSPVLMASTMWFDGKGVPGDINDDDRIDLKDAIQVLGILTGKTSAESESIELENTIGGNFKVGLDDAIYILQETTKSQ